MTDISDTTVNPTQPETWYEKAWRPACGFAVAIGSVIGVVGITYLGYKGISNPAALNIIPSLSSSLVLLLGVPGAATGIAAWHKGVQQVEATKGTVETNIAKVNSATTVAVAEVNAGTPSKGDGQ